MKPRIIAFYLPQFHPFKENDEWWGKGFTEWTNVGKAKPLFKGHNQPRVPTELGYYDLRLPIVREQQAQMAKDAGIEAFCYWHYWFGNGKRLIADIFDEVLNSGKPEFPFCLGWANHSWFAKNWNKDGTTGNDKLLIEQTYPGVEDEKLHFQFLLKAFRDDRYVKVNGAPLLFIFDPIAIPSEYIDNFKRWTIEAGFPDLYLIANIGSKVVNKIKPEDMYLKGFNAVNYERTGGITNFAINSTGRIGRGLYGRYRDLVCAIFKVPRFRVNYKDYLPFIVTDKETDRKIIPTIIPQWDHTPRSGLRGTIFVNTSPKYFYENAKMAINAVKGKPEQEQLIFLKSWNEWGEGNMMEPDITFGRGFIEALRKAVDEVNNK